MSRRGCRPTSRARRSPTPGRWPTKKVSKSARLGEGTEIFFLMGADQAFELHLWHDVRKLSRLCTLVPVTRPGFVLDRLDELKPHLPAGMVRKLKSAATEIPPVDVSSTEIRRRVRAGESISGLVPPAVAEYIRTHKLYRD